MRHFRQPDTSAAEAGAVAAAAARARSRFDGEIVVSHDLLRV
ncbi:hypothetical protein [Haloechinothrix aidingensis]|nr:hypothetical protein [Haloechinothrix aidingensis]